MADELLHLQEENEYLRRKLSELNLKNAKLEADRQQALQALRETLKLIKDELLHIASVE